MPDDNNITSLENLMVLEYFLKNEGVSSLIKATKKIKYLNFHTIGSWINLEAVTLLKPIILWISIRESNVNGVLWVKSS